MNTRAVSTSSLRLGLAVLASSLLLAPLAALGQGYGNTATGWYTLYYNSSGNDNTADGVNALMNNTTGSFNTASGCEALSSNTIGNNNTASGRLALFSNTTGNSNTANGYQALYANSTGSYNIANGFQALCSNTTGNSNIANGYQALYSNSAGNWNIASGYQALYANTTGNRNLSNGYRALMNNTTGSNNTADGVYALIANISGSNNIAIGYRAGQNLINGDNNITIGNDGGNGDDSVIRLGTQGTHQATYIAGINGVTISKGVAVYIDANGQLGTITSSRRFKYDIQNLGTTSDKLMNLRPVSFRYKQASEDGSHPVQYGLIAEEVAKVYPEMVQYDKQGKPFTVYYQLLTPLMLNELQKAHQRADAQEAQLASLRHTQNLQLIAFAGFALAILAGAIFRNYERNKPLWASHSPIYPQKSA